MILHFNFLFSARHLPAGIFSRKKKRPMRKGAFCINHLRRSPREGQGKKEENQKTCPRLDEQDYYTTALQLM